MFAPPCYKEETDDDFATIGYTTAGSRRVQSSSKKQKASPPAAGSSGKMAASKKQRVEKENAQLGVFDFVEE